MFLSIILSFIAFRVKVYKISPHPKTFWENLDKATEEDKDCTTKYSELMTNLNKELSNIWDEIKEIKIKKIKNLTV